MRSGRLGVDEAVGIARQVAEALRCAHEAGVIHRDLKPQNILIDGDGNALVTDFGIAKSAELGGLTVTGQIIGTPEYMSPEQAEGLEVDYRTDIYSFGLVLYEMLTGQVAFKADTVISTLMKRLRERPQAPSALNPAVPAWLDRLTGKALERDLGDRYASVDEILADIESQTVRVRRRLRPRTLGVVAAVAGLGLLGALTAVLKPSLVFHQERTYLAILPFENATGDSELDWLVSGIPDNLTADLAQSRYFRIMSAERLRQVVDEMGKDAADLTSADLASHLARATDLDAVAMGSFIRSGGEMRITLRVENAHNHEIIGSQMVKGSEADLLAMIDELTRMTKQIFNLSQKAIDADLDRDVALQRTKSVKAAADFAKGLDLAHQGSHLEAVRAFEAAIEADPDFAIAYAKAAEAYKNLGYDDKAESLSLRRRRAGDQVYGPRSAGRPDLHYGQSRRHHPQHRRGGALVPGVRVRLSRRSGRLLQAGRDLRFGERVGARRSQLQEGHRTRSQVRIGAVRPGQGPDQSERPRRRAPRAGRDPSALSRPRKPRGRGHGPQRDRRGLQPEERLRKAIEHYQASIKIKEDLERQAWHCREPGQPGTGLRDRGQARPGPGGAQPLP